MLEARNAYANYATPLSGSESDLQSLADTLLQISSTKQPYFLITAGVGVYFALLVVLLTVDFSPPPMTLEAPVEMAYEDAPEQQATTPPPPAEEKPPEPIAEQQPEPPPPPPPVAEKPPDPIAEPLPEPPPPVAEKAAEPVAVAEPPKPPEPKPEPAKEEPRPPQAETPPAEKPKPKPKPRAAHTSGAVPSDYANKVYQRINRIASNSFPRGALTQKSVRIGYVITIGSSGQLIAKSVSSSGIAALDRAVSDALSRSAPFPAPPNLGASSYRISGAIVYRLH